MSFALKKLYPFYYGNVPLFSSRRMPVIHKYTGKPISEVCIADEPTINNAALNAAKSQKKLRDMPPYKRKEILLQIASKIHDKREILANILVMEVGKTISDARGEVGRAIDTFTISAEESVRQIGKFQNMEISPRSDGFQLITSRFPIGLVSMIVPFNFPLNLAAHKVGPAIAVGCPFILKPSERTPLSAIFLGEILSQTELPEHSFSILPCDIKEAPIFSTNEQIKYISFTGSDKIGWSIKANSGKKKIGLELGGNAACVIDEDVDIEYAVNRAVFGAFAGNGQSCISVQRFYVHDKVYSQFVSKFVTKTSNLVVGDPHLESTQVGPLIDQSEVLRLLDWTKSAVEKGAKILCGGKYEGNCLWPTILENVHPQSMLSCKEAFGPICTISRFTDFKAVIDEVNNSQFGLQAGIFTNDIHKSFYAYQHLEVGGVVLNDVPTARVDAMPYGGIKDSGLGREGIIYAMEEMTEMKGLLMKNIGKL